MGQHCESERNGEQISQGRADWGRGRCSTVESEGSTVSEGGRRRRIVGGKETWEELGDGRG